GQKVFDDRAVHMLLEQRKHSDEFIAGRLRALAMPEAVADVVLRACRSKPEERYPSVDDFGGAMRAALRSAAGPDMTRRLEELVAAEGFDTIPGGTLTKSEGVMISVREPGEILAAGRRLRVIAATDQPLDVESQFAGSRGALRFRLTLIPVKDG